MRKHQAECTVGSAMSGGSLVDARIHRLAYRSDLWMLDSALLLLLVISFNSQIRRKAGLEGWARAPSRYTLTQPPQRHAVLLPFCQTE